MARSKLYCYSFFRLVPYFLLLPFCLRICGHGRALIDVFVDDLFNINVSVVVRQEVC